eukprot:c20859_g1_i1.p1 GENE.c20859_g1_i1~~c20859_g1_i1.p1  ORF type:complete len:216 (-),score=25.91 c20859_g1_i1:126-773(-)
MIGIHGGLRKAELCKIKFGFCHVNADGQLVVSLPVKSSPLPCEPVAAVSRRVEDDGSRPKQCRGLHWFEKLGFRIAEKLGLPDPALYTSHTWKRTAATWLANAGLTSSDLQRHFEWKSPSVAEGYVAESTARRAYVSSLLSSSCNQSAGVQTANREVVQVQLPTALPSTDQQLQLQVATAEQATPNCNMVATSQTAVMRQMHDIVKLDGFVSRVE